MLEATSNYYHIRNTLSKHLDVTVAYPKKMNQIADTDKKTDRVDAKELYSTGVIVFERNKRRNAAPR